VVLTGNNQQIGFPDQQNGRIRVLFYAGFGGLEGQGKFFPPIVVVNNFLETFLIQETVLPAVFQSAILLQQLFDLFLFGLVWIFFHVRMLY
jgi:hypothetical protein